MWGIIPAAGRGNRIQPLAFSKELLPVGSRAAFDGTERPKAVSEYIVERMLLAGAKRLCFVISPGKTDIIEYYGGSVGGAEVCYVVQQEPKGLCDSIFRALTVVGPGDEAFVGLPDTVWFPSNGLAALSSGLSFLLFPVERPEFFDAVVTEENMVKEIQVKSAKASTRWVWGAFRLSGAVMRELFGIWEQRGRSDEYIGAIVNEYIKRGGRAEAYRGGDAYVDVGTLNGYREAITLLSGRYPDASV